MIAEERSSLDRVAKDVRNTVHLENDEVENNEQEIRNKYEQREQEDLGEFN